MQVRKIIQNISSKMDSCELEEIVIESHLCILSLWGEALAEAMKAKHIVNFLEEDVPSFNKNAISFFEYKLKRWECLNASEQSLRRLFKEDYKEEYNSYNHVTTFYCSNVMEDSPVDPKIVLPDSNSFNILSIGRLNKPYIKTVISEVFDFAEKNKDINIALVFVGASPDGSVEIDILAKSSILSNVKVYFMGYMYPIPLKIIKCADIAICSSNSVLVPFECGIPTISVDANDYYAIGIYGVNTNNTVFRNDEPMIPIGHYVKQLYNGEITSKSSFQNANNDADSFNDQIKFLHKSQIDYNYYNIYDIYSYPEIIVCVIKRLVSYIIKPIKS